MSRLIFENRIEYVTVWPSGQRRSPAKRNKIAKAIGGSNPSTVSIFAKQKEDAEKTRDALKKKCAVCGDEFFLAQRFFVLQNVLLRPTER